MGAGKDSRDTAGEDGSFLGIRRGCVEEEGVLSNKYYFINLS